MAPPHPAHHTPPSLPYLLSPRGFLGSFLQLPLSIAPQHAEEGLASPGAFGKRRTTKLRCPRCGTVDGAASPAHQHEISFLID